MNMEHSAQGNQGISVRPAAMEAREKRNPLYGCYSLHREGWSTRDQVAFALRVREARPIAGVVPDFEPADGESPKAGNYRPRSVFLVDRRHPGDHFSPICG